MMPTKDATKEIYLALRNEDGTLGELILLKPMKGKASDLYADSNSTGEYHKG